MNFKEFFKQAYGTAPRHSGSREAAMRNPEKEPDKRSGPYDCQRTLVEEPWPDLKKYSSVPETETPPRGRRRADDTLISGVNSRNIVFQKSSCQGRWGRQVLRVMSYIDGFNLYFGLRSKGWRKYYWLDPARLSQALLKPNQQLMHCHYFTARIRTSVGNYQDTRRQSLWLDALRTVPNLSICYGHYLPKRQTCRNCGAQWISHEEKMTDVNIAVQLLADAYENRFNTALVISGDSDLTTPLKRIRQRCTDKRIIVAFPLGRHSDQLRKTANGNFTIGEVKLRQNRMPDRITTATGHTLIRPNQWY